MNEKDVLVNLLMPKCGINALPKADGRVEIPQSLIKAMGWQKQQIIFINKKPGELLLCSQQTNETIGKTIVSCGRIRIPAGILKSIGFIKKPLQLTLGNGCILIRVDCSEKKEDVKRLVSQLSTFDVKELSSALLGDQGRVAKLFLLEEHLVVRPLRPPFRFPGYLLSTKELVLFKTYVVPQKPTLFYLLPVIKLLSSRLKERYDFGYLVLHEDNYGAVLGALKRTDSGNLNRSLIFYYRPFSIGMWSVYLTPPDDIPENIIENGKRICNNTETFLKKFFREFKEQDAKFIINSPLISGSLNVD